MDRRVCAPLIGWLCAAALPACSGNGVGLDANGQPLGSAGSSGPVSLAANFDAIQANVFTPICSLCHFGANAPEGLMLDAAHSYSLLVDVPSTEVPSLLRVDPGHPATSYIIQKLEGTAAVGSRMPLDEPPLPASTIADIVQWITDGAAPGTAAMAMAARPFALTASAPEEGAVLTVSPVRIVLAFTRELDATQVQAGAVRLERLADPETSITVAQAEGVGGAPIATQQVVPVGDPSALLITPQIPLPAGSYQVLASGEPGTELAAIGGVVLGEGTASSQERVLVRFSVHAAGTTAAAATDPP